MWGGGGGGVGFEAGKSEAYSLKGLHVNYRKAGLPLKSRGLLTFRGTAVVPRRICESLSYTSTQRLPEVRKPVNSERSALPGRVRWVMG